MVEGGTGSFWRRRVAINCINNAINCSPGRTHFRCAGGYAASKKGRSVTLRQPMKATRRWLDCQRLAAGSIEAATRDASARDVSPHGGGLIHTTVAPPRREHCNISRAILLMCLLAASGDNNHVSICCSGAGVSVGGGGPSCVVVFLSLRGDS